MNYSLTRATAWNLGGYLYLIIASLISTPILLHSLGLAVFAQYGLILASLSLVSSLDLGLPQAVVRSLSQVKNYTSRHYLWATSSLLFTLSGLIAGIIALILCLGLHLPWLTLAVIFLLALITNLVSHYQTLPQSTGHFGYYNAKTFIVGTGNTLVAAYLSWIGQSLTIILVALLASYLLTLFVLAYFSLKYFPLPWKYQPNLSTAKPLVIFGLKNQAGKLVGQIQAQYSKYLLSGVAPLLLSSYFVAINLIQKASGVIVQLATAFYPAASAGAVNKVQIRRTYYRLQFALFILGILGVIIYRAWGLPLLTFWLGSSIFAGQVYSILGIFVWYLVVLILTPLASTILDAYGRPGLTSSFATLTTAIEIATAVILFPRYGVMAPAYAGLLAVTLTTPALLYFTHQTLTKVK